MNLSESIKKYRTNKGYTQEQLASLLGVSAQAVSKWETSETYPDGALLVPLANALDVSLDTLFGNASASMREISDDIRRLMASVPPESEFSTVRDLCWQIEKAMFGTRTTMDGAYDPEELKTQHRSSYILNDYGFTHVSNGRTPFFMVVPTQENNLSEVVGDGEEMRKIFAALSAPDTMRAVLFLHRQEEGFLFEDEVLAKACDMGKEQITHVLCDLIALQLIGECHVEIDGEPKTLYSFAPSHLIMALFLLTHEMNYAGGYCYQSLYREKPFLTN